MINRLIHIWIIAFCLISTCYSQSGDVSPAFILKPLVTEIDFDDQGNPISFFKRLAYRRISGTADINKYYLTNMDTKFLVQKHGTSNDWWQNFRVSNEELIHDFNKSLFHETIRFDNQTKMKLISHTSGQNKTGIIDLGYCFNFYFPLNGGRSDTLVWQKYNSLNTSIQKIFKNMIKEMNENISYRIQILSSASNEVATGVNSESLNIEVSKDRLIAGFNFFVELYNQKYPSSPLNVTINEETLEITGFHSYRFITESSGITFLDKIDNELNIDRAIRFRLIP